MKILEVNFTLAVFPSINAPRGDGLYLISDLHHTLQLIANGEHEEVHTSFPNVGDYIKVDYAPNKAWLEGKIINFTDNAYVYQEYEILGRFCRKKTPSSVIPSMIPDDAQIFSVYSNTYLKLPSPQEVPVKFGAFMEKLMKKVR